MTKWYEVKITSVQVFAVEVEDCDGEDEAMEAAQNEVSEWTEIECSPEITSSEDIDRMKRYADEVLPL